MKTSSVFLAFATSIISLFAAHASAAAEAAQDQTAIRLFKIQVVSQTALDDLRRRIAATRWPEKETVADDSQGVQLATMKALAAYWGKNYDWRKCEAKLKTLLHFVTKIDGLDIHFIHVRSKNPNALPMIITHEWPGSIIEQLKIFASREKAILSHFEVGPGIVPGGGPMARLPRLMGRGRALEVLLGADDIPGDLAERYGYVNLAFPDAELDEFVDSLANRIASFDKRAISETKRFVDVASLAPDYELAPEWDVCVASIMPPAAQERIKKLMEQGFHKPGDVENRLGYYVGQLARSLK